MACAARRQPGNSGQGSVGEIGIFEALRQSGLDDIQVLTTVPHSSLSKAASIVGLGRACVKLVGQEDAPHRFDMDRLRQCLDTPRTGSIVVISCGEVNTGRFATDGYEDLERLKELCEKHGAWLHVDAGKISNRCVQYVAPGSWFHPLLLSSHYAARNDWRQRSAFLHGLFRHPSSKRYLERVTGLSSPIPSPAMRTSCSMLYVSERW